LRSRGRKPWRLGVLALGISLLSASIAQADESGISFWLPGLFGSFAAAPGVPGFTVATLYYHPSVSASNSKTFLQGGRFETGLKARGDLAMVSTTYVMPAPVLGGQAAFSMVAVGGRNSVSIDGTLTGPMGNTISGAKSEALASFGDLIPQGTLKWNQGVNNFMVYGTGDIPVGDYNSERLANLGIGHGAVDGGAGYTYLDAASGREFSAVAGLTYNFISSATQYQNGIDAHLDWGASQFLNKQLNVGLSDTSSSKSPPTPARARSSALSSHTWRGSGRR
jgi:hypothetical protein